MSDNIEAAARAATDEILDRIEKTPPDKWQPIIARHMQALVAPLLERIATLESKPAAFLKCDSCGQYHEDSTANESASCECSRFLQRADWVKLADLRADRDRIATLTALVRELTDPGECRYDHHGYCQSHSLHERPCPHEVAKSLIKGSD